MTCVFDLLIKRLAQIYNEYLHSGVQFAQIIRREIAAQSRMGNEEVIVDLVVLAVGIALLGIVCLVKDIRDKCCGTAAAAQEEDLEESIDENIENRPVREGIEEGNEENERNEIELCDLPPAYEDLEEPINENIEIASPDEILEISENVNDAFKIEENEGNEIEPPAYNDVFKIQYF